MHDRYESPLSSRYASDEMQYIFSPDKKFSTWRRLWVALARAEMELGLPVTQEQVDELEAHLTDIDYDKAAAYEKKLRHDVMAHIHAYGAQCPSAMPILHLQRHRYIPGVNLWLSNSPQSEKPMEPSSRKARFRKPAYRKRRSSRIFASCG